MSPAAAFDGSGTATGSWQVWRQKPTETTIPFAP